MESIPTNMGIENDGAENADGEDTDNRAKDSEQGSLPTSGYDIERESLTGSQGFVETEKQASTESDCPGKDDSPEARKEDASFPDLEGGGGTESSKDDSSRVYEVQFKKGHKEISTADHPTGASNQVFDSDMAPEGTKNEVVLLDLEDSEGTTKKQEDTTKEEAVIGLCNNAMDASEICDTPL